MTIGTTVRDNVVARLEQAKSTQATVIAIAQAAVDAIVAEQAFLEATPQVSLDSEVDAVKVYINTLTKYLE